MTSLKGPTFRNSAVPKYPLPPTNWSKTTRWEPKENQKEVLNIKIVLCLWSFCAWHSNRQKTRKMQSSLKIKNCWKNWGCRICLECLGEVWNMQLVVVEARECWNMELIAGKSRRLSMNESSLQCTIRCVDCMYPGRFHWVRPTFLYLTLNILHFLVLHILHFSMLHILQLQYTM